MVSFFFLFPLLCLKYKHLVNFKALKFNNSVKISTRFLAKDAIDHKDALI